MELLPALRQDFCFLMVNFFSETGGEGIPAHGLGGTALPGPTLAPFLSVVGALLMGGDQGQAWRAKLPGVGG